MSRSPSDKLIAKFMDMIPGLTKEQATVLASQETTVWKEVGAEQQAEDSAENKDLCDTERAEMEAEIKKLRSAFREFCAKHPYRRSGGGTGVRNSDNSPEGQERRDDGFLAPWWKAEVEQIEWQGNEAETRALLSDRYIEMYEIRKGVVKTPEQVKRYSSRKHAYMTVGAPARA